MSVNEKVVVAATDHERGRETKDTEVILPLVVVKQRTWEPGGENRIPERSLHNRTSSRHKLDMRWSGDAQIVSSRTPDIIEMGGAFACQLLDLGDPIPRSVTSAIVIFACSCSTLASRYWFCRVFPSPCSISTTAIH